MPKHRYGRIPNLSKSFPEAVVQRAVGPWLKKHVHHLKPGSPYGHLLPHVVEQMKRDVILDSLGPKQFAEFLDWMLWAVKDEAPDLGLRYKFFASRRLMLKRFVPLTKAAMDPRFKDLLRGPVRQMHAYWKIKQSDTMR